jgi:hypothetical protein
MRRQLGDSWGRLDHERVGTWWRVWGMRKDETAPMDYRCLVLEEGRLGGMLEGVDGTASPEEMTTAASRSGRPTLSLRCKQTSG